MTARLSTDFEWPPGSGKWYRPGPVFQARWQGVWPSAGILGVWSEGLWDAACVARKHRIVSELPRIGADIARFGDDSTCLHLRWGNVSIEHESYNHRDLMETCGSLVSMARRAAALVNRNAGTARHITAQEIQMAIDDDGLGGGVVDRMLEQEFSVFPVSAGSSAKDEENYPNMRSELWFAAAKRAEDGRMDLSRLPVDVRNKLRSQAMSPKWKINSQGQRVVEPKEETKKKLGRSPDDMDGLNLAYNDASFIAAQWGGPQWQPKEHGGPESNQERRGMYGR